MIIFTTTTTTFISSIKLTIKLLAYNSEYKYLFVRGPVFFELKNVFITDSSSYTIKTRYLNA